MALRICREWKAHDVYEYEELYQKLAFYDDFLERWKRLEIEKYGKINHPIPPDAKREITDTICAGIEHKWLYMQAIDEELKDQEINGLWLVDWIVNALHSFMEYYTRYDGKRVEDTYKLFSMHCPYMNKFFLENVRAQLLFMQDRYISPRMLFDWLHVWKKKESFVVEGVLKDLNYGLLPSYKLKVADYELFKYAYVNRYIKKEEVAGLIELAKDNDLLDIIPMLIALDGSQS